MARLLMRVLTRDGVLDVEVSHPYERSVVGSYWNDVRFFLEAEPYNLTQYRGFTVAGHALETDPDWLEYWAEQGETRVRRDLHDQVAVGREDDERREIRRERHRRRLGARQPRCARCGEQEPAALVRRGHEIGCYACLASSTGRRVVEAHHFAGRRNDPLTVPLPANWHRIVSDDQYRWDPETLRNPAGSPLRAGAAAVRGRLAVERVMVERIDSWLPDYLEQLDTRLTAFHGEQWWEVLELPRPPFMT